MMAMAFCAELKKARRRHDIAVCLLVPLLAVMMSLPSAPSAANRPAQGYTMLFYSLPLYHATLFPVAMGMLASRLWDVETKGGMPKLLYTLQTRRSLFCAKALVGLAELLLICIVELLGILAQGICLRFTEPLPAGQVLYFLICTFSVSAMLFLSELLLTILASNPLPALCVGIAGSLTGLFSAFLPRSFGRLIPWGYYVPLSAYVMLDWDPATRLAVYGIQPFRYGLLGGVLLLAALLFFLTWRILRDQEV
ncbi:MAG: ABC transporter permease [Gemmiger sp.]